MRERCFIPFCLKTYNKEEYTVVQDPWPGILACWVTLDKTLNSLSFPFNDTVLASFMEHSQIH